MGYNLFLDDRRTLEKAFEKTKDPMYIEKDWIVATSHSEFVRTIQNQYEVGNFPNLISFDFDLHEEHIEYFFNNGGRENPPDPMHIDFINPTGLDCAQWLIDFCKDNGLKLPMWKIHSSNPKGSNHIENILKSAEK